MVDFAEIKARVSIEEAVRFLGIEVKKHGEQLRGRCPMTEGANERSFVVTPAKGLWYSFAASEGGDCIQLVAKVRNVSVKEAAQLLAEQFVTETLKPIDYLVYDHESLTALGLTRETCEHFESGWKPKGLLSGRLAIACHDARGNLVGYVGRAVKRGQEPILTFPKNLDQDVLFNEHRIEPGKDLWVADDPLRVLVAYQHDIQAVSFLGRITPSNLRRLADLIERLQLTGVALL